MGTTKRLVSTILQVAGSILIIAILILAIQLFRPNYSPTTSIVPGAYPPPGATATTAPYPGPQQVQGAPALTGGDALAQKYDRKITPTVPPIADDGWYIFSAPDVGYSFHYPKDSHVSSGSGRIVPFTSITMQYSVPNETGYHGMLILVKPNPKNLSTIDYGKSIFSDTNPSLVNSADFATNTSSVTVGAKITATKFNIPTVGCSFTLLIPYRGKMIMISPTYNGMAFSEDPEKAQSLEIFDKIMSTFALEP